MEEGIASIRQVRLRAVSMQEMTLSCRVMQADLDDIMDALSGKGHRYPITKAELQVTAKRVLETVLKLA